MTLETIRDELAKLAGQGWIEREGCYDSIDGCHPIPATLEESAKLPEGWTWQRWNGDWMADISYLTSATVPDTGSELYDRFLLRLRCEQAEKGKQ